MFSCFFLKRLGIGAHLFDGNTAKIGAKKHGKVVKRGSSYQSAKHSGPGIPSNLDGGIVEKGFATGDVSVRRRVAADRDWYDE
jgi:hypothetical protein